MIVVGGTYTEVCLEPQWDQIFGSGFRAVSLILENFPTIPVEYFTCADAAVKAHLELYTQNYSNFKLQSSSIFLSPGFYYDHPLKTPIIFPRPDLYRNIDITLKGSGKSILAYGLLESNIQVDGEYVVFDPQSPVNPIPFSKTGSKAEKLITIINKSEATVIVGSADITKIRDYFFNIEKCHALIVKMGPQGAFVFEDSSSDPIIIPVYRTQSVWPIGSGDVFSAYFAASWFQGETISKSAFLASQATATYCNSKSLSIQDQLKVFSFSPIEAKDIPVGKIYIAGPFFTFTQRWLINEIRNTLKSIGLNTFSPFHDVGHGRAKDVVGKDIKGLKESEIVFAVMDGLDSGTLFEVGYAISEGKKVIAFVQNETDESLKMLEGTGCLIVDDLTTAIYKTFWELASK